MCDEWCFQHNLGSGGFGIVQLWMHAPSSTKLAVKKCNRSASELTEEQKQRWNIEVTTMQKLDHPNIVQTICKPFKLPNYNEQLPVLYMEYCKNGDLRRVLNNSKNCSGLEEQVTLDVMSHVSSAVEYLHGLGLTHRDLKPENIVLQEINGKIIYKLIDLGFAKDLGQDSIYASIVGTLNYVAPELLWKDKYSCSVDYWSLGVLFYETITGKRPWPPNMMQSKKLLLCVRNKTHDDIRANEVEGNVVFEKNIEQPTDLSCSMQSKLIDWFKIALEWDPKKRGKNWNGDGTANLVIFSLLKKILSKRVLKVFSISHYKIFKYEIDSHTTILNLQKWLERDTQIEIQHQILTDYNGKILFDESSHILELINELVLFIFKNSNELSFHTDSLNTPIDILNKTQLVHMMDHNSLRDYYRNVIFFMKQELSLRQLYIFALSIKMDIINTHIGSVHKMMENELIIKDLVEETHKIGNKIENENSEQCELSKPLFLKINKLITANDQIKMKFNKLKQGNNLLQNSIQHFDQITNLPEIYDKVLKLFENLRQRKSASSKEIVKLLFEFLKSREKYFKIENAKILKQLIDVETQLVVLQESFNSLVVMTQVYQKDVQELLLTEKYTFNSVTTSNLQPSESADSPEDLIYENILIRNMIQTLLTEVQNHTQVEEMDLDFQ